MEKLTAGQLAKKANVNVETIRYYERRCILPRPTPTRSGYRIYPDEAVQRIPFVKRAQKLGFSLKEVQELLGLRVTPGITSTDIRKRAEMKICHIDRKIQDLKTMRKNLAQLINACPACAPLSECPILEDLNDRRNS